jgi:hypothetical protein
VVTLEGEVDAAAGGTRRKLEDKQRLLQTVEVTGANTYQLCTENLAIGVYCVLVGLNSFDEVIDDCPTGTNFLTGVTYSYPPGALCTLLIVTYSFEVVDADGAPITSFTFDTSGIPQELLDAIVYDIGAKVNNPNLEIDDGDQFGGTFHQVKVYGDPHFKTWGGKWFDFMGECDLKMIHAPHFDGENKPLDVDVRTKIRYDYSYVESAAVKLGNDTLEVASFGDYFLNGVAGAAMPAFVGGYPVTHSNPSNKVHVFEIALSDSEKIVIKTFKDLVAVSVEDTDSKRLKGTLGMAGSYDKHGKMLGRDGETEMEDPTAFANEWQIRQDETSLFHVAKGPQHPEQCKLPEISTSDKRRRLGEGLAREKAERACAHFSGEQFENCVFDVMAVGDIEIAQAGAY